MLNTKYISTEVKIINICGNDIKTRLESLGAQKVFDDDRVIMIFDYEDLRLRRNNEEIKLTEEGKLKLSHTSLEGDDKEEIKVFVSRKNEIVDFLEKIGLRPVTLCQSHRVSYEWNNIDFDIDTFPFIPDFIEIDLGATDVSIEKVLELLDLQECEVTTHSTPEIYNLYGLDYYRLFGK